MAPKDLPQGKVVHLFSAGRSGAEGGQKRGGKPRAQNFRARSRLWHREVPALTGARGKASAEGG